MDITYTALPGGVRVSGHSAGVPYQISGVHVTVMTPRERVVNRGMVTTLDGTAHAAVDRVDTEWSVTTDIIDADDWDHWRELAASASPSTTVRIDPGDLYGMQSGDIVGYITGGVQFTRVGELGRFRASFTVREPH